MTRKTFVLAYMLLSAALMAARAGAQTGPTARTAAETELIDLDRRLQEAMVTGDVKVLGQYLADDFIFTHGLLTGGSQSRADMLKTAAIRPRMLIYRKVSSQVVELHSDVGLVFGRLDIRRMPFTKNGETEQMCYALNYAHLYQRRKGQWYFISHRTAQSIDPAKPCANPQN